MNNMTSLPNMQTPSGQHMVTNNSRSQTISYADLMKPDEDWRMLPDAAERRKIQNRLAQRAYRRNMRDRTKELEKLKKELAKLKEQPANANAQSQGRLSPRLTPPMQQSRPPQPQPQQQQQQQQQPQPMPVMAKPEDFIFDGSMPDSLSMPAPQWTEPFPAAQFNDQPLHIDPSFFISGADASRPSAKRRRTSAGSDILSPPRTLSLSSQYRPGHQRSRSHTPLSSPPMVRAASPPPPATMAEMQQASQLLSLEPCNFDIPADPLALPPLEDSPPFTLEGFTDPMCNPQAGSFDQGLWTPPMQSSSSGSIYGSFLTPPTTDGAASPPWQQSTPSGSSVRSEIMGRSRSASASTVSRASPFSTATSQFSSSPSLSATLKTEPPTGLNLNLSSCSTDTTPAPAPTQTNSSLLHLAVAGGHTQVLQLLLQRCEVPINARDSAGYTALQRAVFAGRMEMVQMLLEAGADFSAGRQDDGAEAAGGAGVSATAANNNDITHTATEAAAPAS